MDDFEIGKRKKRSRRDRRGVHRERYKPRISSAKSVAANVVQRMNKTHKLYETQSSRSNITRGRITTRPGLFNQGKCTSFVQRALYLSPGKKARMEEDLYRIIQLANGAPDRGPPCCNMLERHQDEDSNFRQSSKQCSEQEMMDICENSKSNRENIELIDPKKKIKGTKSKQSMLKNKTEDLVPPGHDNFKKKENLVSSGIVKPSCILSSSSSSSNDSSDSSSLESISYSIPPLEVYEEFSNSVISALNSKMEYIFSGRSYLKETRDNIRTKYCHNQMNSFIHHLSPKDGWDRATGSAFKSGKQILNGFCLSEPKSSPVMVNQAVGTSVQIAPSRPQEIISSDFSPLPVILSPKTTILNPMEYLKRVEKTDKQKERHLNDSGHETGHSHDSYLSNSQSKINISSDLQDNWNSFHYLLEPNDGHSIPSESTMQNLIYQHSNRSYIDSPQAFKLTEGNFIVSYKQGQPLPVNSVQRELHCQQNSLENTIKSSMLGRRKLPDLEIEQKMPGFQYLMDVSEITHPINGYGDCSDLLDDLDADDCNLMTDSSILSKTTTKRQPELEKQCGPPPFPATPEHKFYRRKMF